MRLRYPLLLLCFISLLLLPTLLVAQQSAPVFVYPQDGMTNVDTGNPFSWNSVTNADSYILTVGTTPGSRNVFGTGSLTDTSCSVPPLPQSTPLYARLRAKVNGVTYSTNIRFTAKYGRAMFTYPKDGMNNVDVAHLFSWTPVQGALGYALTIGTQAGQNDLLDTGVLRSSTYNVPTLPTNQTLYATIKTQRTTGWVSSDITFVVTQTRAVFIAPTANDTAVDVTKPFAWTPVAGARAYYFTLGTTPGGRDIVNSGEISQLSYATPACPIEQPLYARIYTRRSATWVFHEITFEVEPRSLFVYPAFSGQLMDTSVPIRWVPVPSAKSYRLTLSTSQNGPPLVDTGEILQTSLKLPLLPTGQTIYAHLVTTLNDETVTADMTFSTYMKFDYPVSGSIDVDPTTPFTWSPAPTVNSVPATYQLSIGTTPEGRDILFADRLTTNSFTAANLPQNRVLYARVMARINKGSRPIAYTAFMVKGSLITPAQMVSPLPNSTKVNVSFPFHWSQVDVAQAYRLQVFSGEVTVVESGEIHIPRYVVSTLPIGSYTARLSTKIADQWYNQDFKFTVVKTGNSVTHEIEEALWTTNYVRKMADISQTPFPWSPLFSRVTARGIRLNTVCSDYASILVKVLWEMGIGAYLPDNLRPRGLDVAYINNTLDVHTLVEMYNSKEKSWMLLDPTFDMTMTRASDNKPATKEDLHQATLDQNWSAIQYVFLGDYGNSIALGYYADYPLLYLNIPPLGARGTGLDPRPYLDALNSLPVNAPGVYFLSAPQSSVDVYIDGTLQTIPLQGVYSISHSIGARTITLPPNSSVQLQVYRAKRYVF